MTALFDFFKKLVTYDADRDFYAKFNPSVAGDRDLISYRPMRASDIRSIVAIEEQVYNFPWPAHTFNDCMKIGYLCWVCERVDELVGYGILSLGAGEAHVMNICVSPKYQNQGLGRRLMNKLIEVALENRSKTLLLEVRPSNPHAIHLYLSMGFSEIGVRKNYYPAREGREDALMFSLALPPKPSNGG
ncbi:MAG: ribosomal protein S18-alanine N-acetyltransferase [Methylococcaceae bacterium]|nr:ribosomal protein S18-alanine N-acetyltransferase [Methylococcaceae bacterium]MCI0732534.1 ribosomal protein S18-alanine N-acetyltransferase [Methylococcaceae bacterium]